MGRPDGTPVSVFMTPDACSAGPGGASQACAQSGGPPFTTPPPRIPRRMQRVALPCTRCAQLGWAGLPRPNPPPRRGCADIFSSNDAARKREIHLDSGSAIDPPSLKPPASLIDQ